MNLFFEEDGAFKAGTILSSTDSAHQIELPTGKRTKVKKSHVFFEFSSPSPKEFLEAAKVAAEELDVSLLWEFSPEEEFDYKEIGKEYFGDSASLTELAGTLFCLHTNPIYFYRKGRGRYRKAPEETLRLALAAIERKRLQEEKKDQFVKMLLEEGRAPEEIASKAIQLLVKPDKNSIEYKAVKEASDKRSTSPLRLLLEVKAIPNAWHYHVDSFFSIHFPGGKAFSDKLELPDPASHDDLPLAEAEAFSIDDSNTTEVDDAFSVVSVGDNRTRIGIHISTPGLGIPQNSLVDRAARERMSTVYAPGLKTTMLPENWIKAYSLDEGKVCPVISLYAVVDNETFEVVATETKLERIKIASNIWYDKIEDKVTEEAVRDYAVDLPFGKEMAWIWHFSKHLLHKRELVRGRPEPVGKIDWYFDLDGENENARVQLKGRVRGAPLDLLVAEMMIFANSTWGEFLDKRKTAGIYRSQRMGRVKLTSVPGPHDGMGLEYYAWCTSPLRRYVDMVNQRQLISVLREEDPPYRGNDSDLFSVISTFDENYTAFNDFQARMDRYWSLRWIEQEGIKKVKGIVVKGDLIRFDGIPMMQRVPGLPELPKGQNLLMEVLNLDYLGLVLELKLLEVLDVHPEDLDAADEIGAEDENAEPAPLPAENKEEKDEENTVSEEPDGQP